MAFHSNQPAQRSNMIFPNRNQGISHCPELGQNLNPIGGFNPLGTLDSFGPRQFDANEFDNRAYLNSSDPWKSGSTLLQQEQGDSSNLQCSLLSSVPTDLNGIQSISNSASGFSSQALRIMPQSAGELPYFHQSPLVSVSQQQYSAYQNLPTSNNQSQAISTAHIVSQSPTASFIRRYPDNTNAIGGIDPTSLSSGMGYTNQDYSGELVSLVNFSRNNLTSYVVNDNTMTNSLLAAKTSGTSRNVEDNSQLMFNSIQNGEGEVSASSQGKAIWKAR
ncbi:hypothetical protein K493DRAFT_87380 [Basidiobolus meristosporus CBS 931.73]|uniref:Uncharacterized protein n=1 Tax=Basidiobolus meristosporus CBS 931.73 TaxID=1314790 RepID=A0A1Y1XFE1_9FUNG|nr:hypothetical protein K493DRAFT_87380 [Basidiobolus meristosporus CBS 931.73]|eukprot:ORX84412.1 hypothetical protein K493DRAFT_87380 [Basidiobolus meristosporus CBS 931.73]